MQMKKMVGATARTAFLAILLLASAMKKSTPKIITRVKNNPIAAKETSKAMEQLLLAYYDARQNSNIADLLLIPCFIVDFLCIHPYLDGNGRVSRLLTVLLLYMSGYDIGRYISIEGQINKYKESYYDALEQSSEKWHENKNDYTPFMVNFMQILYRCYKELDESFMDITLKRQKNRVKPVIRTLRVSIHNYQSMPCSTLRSAAKQYAKLRHIVFNAFGSRPLLRVVGEIKTTPGLHREFVLFRYGGQ